MRLFEISSAQFKSPEEIYGELFFQVQQSGVFKDYKTFPDSLPKGPVEEILREYNEQKDQSDFDLKKFVLNNFQLPDLSHSKYTADTTITVPKHIDTLWDILARKVTSQVPNSSLINLPYPYVVPGGRFREIFYWDSYFIMLGLQESGRYDLVQSMVNNFSFLIHTFGYVPNGNRTYFLGRSQPPFYSMMIELLTKQNPMALVDYLPYLEKEYDFWMNGKERLSAQMNSVRRVVRIQDGELLNRYWDQKDTPRIEGYGKELVLSDGMDSTQAAVMYRHIRAACESGWDFSSRWLKDITTLKSCYTTDIIPVDLNCLLYHLETSISKAYQIRGNVEKQEEFFSLSVKRKNAILKYCWSEKDQFFMDYNFRDSHTTPSYSLAGCFPLFFSIATTAQAKEVAQKLKTSFLKGGGFVTTLVSSPFQWDSPNGWAPMQWIAVIGLLNYKEEELAFTGARRWIELNDKIYRSSGKLIEKYNVITMSSYTGGGEYDLQDGFGWTNGVYLKLQSLL